MSGRAPGYGRGFSLFGNLCAVPELNTQQFFHGTTASLQPGDRLKSANEMGLEHSPHRDMYLRPGHTWRPQHVFTDTEENRAWTWAEHASSHTGLQPSVYEVSPSSDVEQHRHLASEHASTSATVKRRIDIPPPEAGVPRQGQLPGAGRWDTYEDKSRHPAPDEPSPGRRKPQRESLF